MTVKNFATNLGLETTGVVGASVRPSLLLDFARSKTVDPRITFTRGSSATRFNASGVLETVAANTPRIDYDPVTLACKGLLIEEQRTNSIFNNTMQGAVVGAPGTLPTNWSELIAGGLTRTITSVGVENGISYVEVRLAGTTTDTNGWNISFQLTTTVPAVSGQAWSFSSFLSLKAGALPGVLRIRTVERNSVGSYVGESNLNCGSLTDDLINNRFNISRTMGVGTGYVSSNVYFVIASGAAVDVTLRIGLPQLELGAFATSVIPTTTTAVTRAADVAVIQGTSFSNWYNQSEGTLYADASVLSTSYNQGVLVDIGAVGTFGTTEYISWTGTSWALSPDAAPLNVSSTVTTLSAAKIAAAIKANDSVISANSLIGAVDTACAVPSAPVALSIGKAGWSVASNFFNGHIARIAYYPKRLTNAELQVLTE